MKAFMISTALTLLSTAVCAQTRVTELILSCNGTVTEDTKNLPRLQTPVKDMGIVVNLKEQTLTGFGNYIAKIHEVDASHFSFEGRSGFTKNDYILGSIDRVTGYIGATEKGYCETKEFCITSTWQLSCTPTKRLF